MIEGIDARRAKAVKKQKGGKNPPRSLPGLTDLPQEPSGEAFKNDPPPGFVEDFMVEAVINLEFFVLSGQLRIEKQCFFFGNDEVLPRLQDESGNAYVIGKELSLPPP